MWQAPEFMRRIGTVLRVNDEDFTYEPLPAWPLWETGRERRTRAPVRMTNAILIGCPTQAP